MINAGEHEISSDLKELCGKGPSFVPTRAKITDFRYKRILTYFVIVSVHDFCSRITLLKQPMQSRENQRSKPLTWSASKTSSPELEAFVSNIGRGSFQDTSLKNITNNLPANNW